MEQNSNYKKGFIPYALAAFLIGIIGGFSTILGPSFVRDIGIDYKNTTWTALAQAMSTAACAPVLGKIGDVIGRKITLLVGIVVFTIGNIFSALADNLTFMLIARFIVGVGTASMTPVIISYIVANFPKEHLSKGFALYMLISSTSVILGPISGSLITSIYGWRIMQWFCVAICIVIFILCLLTFEKSYQSKHPLIRFDTFGAVMVFIFFSLVLCIPSFGQNFGWNSKVFICILFASFISFICLTYIEKHAVNPILPGFFMKRRVFILSIIALFLTQGLMQANMTNTIVFVNYIRPTDTTVSGYAISVMYLGMSLGAVLLGPLADRFEPKHILICSFILTLTGCGVMLFYSLTTSSALLIMSLGLLGFGLGGNGTVFMKIVLSGLSSDNAGAVTGTYGLFRDLAAPFGVAVFVPLYTNQITDLTENGIFDTNAAVISIHSLAKAELICVAAGIVTVLLLPKIYHKGETL